MKLIFFLMSSFFVLFSKMGVSSNPSSFSEEILPKEDRDSVRSSDWGSSFGRMSEDTRLIGQPDRMSDLSAPLSNPFRRKKARLGESRHSCEPLFYDDENDEFIELLDETYGLPLAPTSQTINRGKCIVDSFRTRDYFGSRFGRGYAPYGVSLIPLMKKKGKSH